MGSAMPEPDPGLLLYAAVVLVLCSYSYRTGSVLRRFRHFRDHPRLATISSPLAAFTGVVAARRSLLVPRASTCLRRLGVPLHMQPYLCSIFRVV